MVRQFKKSTLEMNNLIMVRNSGQHHYLFLLTTINNDQP